MSGCSIVVWVGYHDFSKGWLCSQCTANFQLIILVPVILIILVPMLPEEWTARFVKLLLEANIQRLALTAATVLLVLNVIMLVAASSRFQRARMILD
jgi:hypothetical protein